MPDETTNQQKQELPKKYTIANLLGVGACTTIIVGGLTFMLTVAYQLKQVHPELRPSAVYRFNANDDSFEDFVVVNDRREHFVFLGGENGYTRLDKQQKIELKNVSDSAVRIKESLLENQAQDRESIYQRALSPELYSFEGEGK